MILLHIYIHALFKLQTLLEVYYITMWLDSISTIVIR